MDILLLVGLQMVLKSVAVQQTLWIIVECIVNSENFAPRLFPWVTGIVNNRGISLCSGCIVERHMVITSSICLVKHMRKERNAAKKLIVIAPADDPVVPRTVYMILLHPESRANNSIEHVGLLGVYPSFDDIGNLQYAAPIWNRDHNLLRDAYKYILDNISTFQCYVLAWPYTGTGKLVRKNDKIVAQDYRIDQVHAVHVLPFLDEECDKHILAKCNDKSFTSARTCALILTHGARICEYDMGAGLFCSNYLWGIAIGNHSCKFNDSVHEFIRIDSAIDFIAKQSIHVSHHSPSACPSTGRFLPSVILGILIAILGHLDFFD